MKEILLKRLSLKNWRSLNIEVEFNEDCTTIHGKNELGKSSLFHAWCWLMSGYTDCNHAIHYNLYDEKEPLSENTPTASVKATIIVNGIEYTIERTAKPSFRLDRMTNTYVKSASDIYKCFIDDIEVTNSHWQEFITTNVCDKDMLVYLLSGDFLSTLTIDDKNKARKVLLSIVGEIEESDYKGDYSCLTPYLAKGYSMKQIEEIAKKKISELDKELSSIPHRMETNDSIIAEYSQNDFAMLQGKADELRSEITRIDNEMLSFSMSVQDKVAKQREQLAEVRSIQEKIIKQEKLYLDAFNAKRNEINAQIEEIKRSNSVAILHNKAQEGVIIGWQKRVSDEEKHLDFLLSERERLIAERDAIKERVFTDDKCVYCGQELPIDKLQEKKQEFLVRKENDLTSIVTRGKNVKNEIEETETLIEQFKGYIEKGADLKELQCYEHLEKELKELDDSFIPFQNTQEWEVLNMELKAKQDAVDVVDATTDKNFNEEKDTIIKELELVNQKLGLKNQVEKLKAENVALSVKQRELGAEIAEYKGIEVKAKEYIEEQANIVSEKINKKLNGVTIEMFRTQKNGERVPDCTIHGKGGVRYETINNSAKTLINIELQKMMMNHFDVSLPVWIDECLNFDSEHRPKVDGQHIFLYASDEPYICVE